MILAILRLILLAPTWIYLLYPFKVLFGDIRWGYIFYLLLGCFILFFGLNKRKDIQFESFLEKALRDDGSSIIGKRTDEKHFQIGRENKLDGVEANFIEENSTVMRFDGNNVDIEKEKAIDLAAFEKLTNEKDLYSIHRPNSRKNVRIIYTIIDRKIIILLTVFLIGVSFFVLISSFIKFGV